MNTIRINFTDFWKNFDPKNNSILRKLEKNYKVVFSEDPDYLFYSCYGYEHLKYNCVRIFYTGENIVPDFNICDYAIGFHYLNFNDRYRRIPLFSSRSNYPGLLDQKKSDNRQLLNRKFCNFLYSNKNNAHPIRKKFFDKLSEYKQVDSGGGYLNNLGYKVPDKLSFLSEYKFTIAFENSAVKGYTTEKLVDPMSVNSLPIYWGNPDVGQDFNVSSFIRLENSSDKEIKKVIEKIRYLDQNDDEYLKLMDKPWLTSNQFIEAEKLFDDFINHIFSLSLDKANKRAHYGYNRYYTRRVKNYVFKPFPGTRLKNKISDKLKEIFISLSK